MSQIESKIRLTIKEAIETKVFPGAVFLVIHNNEVFYHEAFGNFTYDPNSSKVNIDTIYDLASVTKQIVNTALLRLVDQNMVNINDPVSKYFPNLIKSDVGNTKILQLLTHTSGIQVETSKLNKNQLNNLIKEFLLNIKINPEARVEYGNINTYLVGEIIIKVSDKSLGNHLKKHIFDQLLMKDTFFNPPLNLINEIPPTEILNDGTIIQGVVHDESSRMMGGEVGQAGLFSNAVDLAKFMIFWLGNDNPILSQKIINISIKNQTSNLNLASGLGWHLDNEVYLGKSAPKGTFFHPGFTGTLIGGNKKNNLGFVFLSNCTYPRRDGHKLKNLFFQELLTDLFNHF
ncbi:MAG: serine hydrolase domain-containing protein [Patescibacteria group bacterium]